MPFWHGEKGKKKTGGEISLARGKRKNELGSVAIHTRLGTDKRRTDVRKRGNIKVRAMATEFANVTDPKNNTTKKVKILGVVENKANPHFVRRLIITKGAVLKTEIGNAIVVSRPSQDGVVNAIKVE
jgi:small subunit ribosomal protein S8e